MKFQIGPFAYALILSDKRIYDEEGLEIEARSIEGMRLIVLSPIVEPERRREIIHHEVRECWFFHVPRPTDRESDCQFGGLVDAAFDADIDRQGGNEALLKLEPQFLPKLGSPKTRPEPFASQEVYGRPDAKVCGACDATVLCGSIHTSDPFLHQTTNKTRVHRWMICPACETLTVWQELTTEDGALTGELVPNPPPKMLTGAAARQWLSMNAATPLVTA